MVICKSLGDVWPLWYSRQDGHTEGEHVNRGRDTASFCPPLQVLDSSFLLCLSWLLRSRVRKFRKDLWITLYITSAVCVHLVGILKIICYTKNAWMEYFMRMSHVFLHDQFSWNEHKSWIWSTWTQKNIVKLMFCIISVTHFEWFITWSQ
jgi:hypothetical protein